MALELRARSDLSFPEFFRESISLAVIGAPARPFLATAAAPTALAWFASAVASLAILAALVAHICRLEVPYREAAIRHSERRALRFARMRSGGGAFGASASTARRVPMFPHLAGAGPVAWRQIQELVRNPRGVLLLLSIVGLVSAAAILIPWLRGGDPDLTIQMGRTGMFLVAFLPLLMGDNLACDFRRDLDRMGQLKSWPIRPLALAAGQIAPAAAFATAVQMIGVLALEIATAAIPLDFALLVLALMPAASWVALCIDNLLVPVDALPHRARGSGRRRVRGPHVRHRAVQVHRAHGDPRRHVRDRLSRRSTPPARASPRSACRCSACSPRAWSARSRSPTRSAATTSRATRRCRDQNSMTWRTPRLARSSSSASLMRASG